MKKVLQFIWAAFFLSACSVAGFKQMSKEWIDLPDGSKINAFQAKNSGISGPDVTAIETWRCPKGIECGKVGAYSGSAPGAVEVGVAGMGAAAVVAGGNVGAAALLRPTRINESTNVTGVSGDIDSSSRSDQRVDSKNVAEGGSGGKNVIEKGAVANTTNNNLTANPTAYGGSGGKGGSTGPVNVKAEGGKAEAEIKNSGNSSSFSNSKSDGGKVIGSGNSTNYNSSGSYSNSSATNYNSNYSNASSSSSNKNISPVDVDVRVQPGESGGKHGRHGGWD